MYEFTYNNHYFKFFALIFNYFLIESESQNKKSKHNSKKVRFEDQQTANSEKKASKYILPKPNIGEDTKECCRTRFFHALGELCTFRSLLSYGE